MKPQTPMFSTNEIVEADLIADGGEQIRPGVWVSHSPKIYSDPTCTELREFDDPRWLRKLLWDDIVAHVISNAVRRGVYVLNISGNYFKFEPRRREPKWAIKPNYELAQKTKMTRLFNKPYIDAGREVDKMTLWSLNTQEVIATRPFEKGMDLARWHKSARKSWHGRHNPTTGETSVATPKRYESKYIPTKLLMGLYNKFGNTIDLMDFIPKCASDLRRLPV